MKRIEKVFGVLLSSFTNTTIQAKQAKVTSNIRLISAKADEIDIGQLFES